MCFSVLLKCRIICTRVVGDLDPGDIWLAIPTIFLLGTSGHLRLCAGFYSLLGSVTLFHLFRPVKDVEAWIAEMAKMDAGSIWFLSTIKSTEWVEAP